MIPERITVWSRLGSMAMDVLRAIGTAPPKDFRIGSDWVSGQATLPAYDFRNAMATIAVFPWVRATAAAVCEDLGGLPIVTADGSAHPVLELLATLGLTQRRQLVLDFVLARNAYILVEGVGGLPGKPIGRPTALRRLHPARTSPVPDASGDVQWFDHNYALGGTRVRYPASAVLHIRDVSWEDGQRGLFGTSIIQALHNDLTADLEASKASARAASSGRPAAIITPTDTRALSDTQTKEIGDKLRAVYKENNGGVAIHGQPLKVDTLGWAPKDMEMPQQRAFTRETVLAVVGTPPTRVGLPMANFATAEQQDLVYWQTLQAHASLFDEAFTKLASMCGKPCKMAHDYSNVTVLQKLRDGKLQRVVTMVSLGIATDEAAEYEGLHGFPRVPVDEVTGDPNAADVAATALNGAQVSSLLLLLASVADGSLAVEAAILAIRAAFPTISETDARAMVTAQAGLEPPAPKPGPPPPPASPSDPPPPPEPAKYFGRVLSLTTAAQRDVIWADWDKRASTPTERRLSAVLIAYHSARRQRTIARARARIKESDADIVTAIIADAEERSLLKRLIGPKLGDALRKAFALTARMLGVKLEYTPSRENEITADLVQRVSDTTRDAISAIVTSGLEAGDTTEDIVARLNEMGEWAPSRSLTIARTESTRSLNAGSDQAQHEAAKLGVKSRCQWVSARDAHVRDAHEALDGEIVNLGDKFKSGVHSAAYPGDFGVPELDINCRCTRIPVPEEE
jgi:hypothetical protein